MLKFVDFWSFQSPFNKFGIDFPNSSFALFSRWILYYGEIQRIWETPLSEPGDIIGRPIPDKAKSSGRVAAEWNSMRNIPLNPPRNQNSDSVIHAFADSCSGGNANDASRLATRARTYF